MIAHLTELQQSSYQLRTTKEKTKATLMEKIATVDQMKKLILETRARKMKLRLAAEAAEAFIMVRKYTNNSILSTRTDTQSHTRTHSCLQLYKYTKLSLTEMRIDGFSCFFTIMNTGAARRHDDWRVRHRGDERPKICASGPIDSQY